MKPMIWTLIIGWLALCGGAILGYSLAALDMAAQQSRTEGQF